MTLETIKTFEQETVDIDETIRNLLLFYIDDTIKEQTSTCDKSSQEDIQLDDTLTKKNYLDGFLNTLSLFYYYLDNHNRSMLKNLINLHIQTYRSK